eukprot:COSAG01_NODE_2097_length_8434_cov_116.410678_2_plen_322_part_00
MAAAAVGGGTARAPTPLPLPGAQARARRVPGAGLSDGVASYLQELAREPPPPRRSRASRERGGGGALGDPVDGVLLEAAAAGAGRCTLPSCVRPFRCEGPHPALPLALLAAAAAAQYLDAPPGGPYGIFLSRRRQVPAPPPAPAPPPLPPPAPPPRTAVETLMWPTASGRQPDLADVDSEDDSGDADDPTGERWLEELARGGRPPPGWWAPGAWDAARAAGSADVYGRGAAAVLAERGGGGLSSKAKAAAAGGRLGPLPGRARSGLACLTTAVLRPRHTPKQRLPRVGRRPGARGAAAAARVVARRPGAQLAVSSAVAPPN